jgi:hypothetical protein
MAELQENIEDIATEVTEVTGEILLNLRLIGSRVYSRMHTMMQKIHKCTSEYPLNIP